MKNVLYFFFCYLLLSACGGKSGNYRIKGNLLYTTAIKDGSYLVMKDSLSGDIDTLFFHGRYHFITEDNYGDYSVEMLSYNFSTVYDSVLQKGTLIDFSAGAQSRVLGATIHYAENATDVFSSRALVVYKEPFTPGTTTASENAENKMIATYNTYEVQNKTYQTVFESQQNSYSAVKNDTTTFNVFYSMHTGIIKIRISNPQRLIVLELIDSNIIR